MTRMLWELAWFESLPVLGTIQRTVFTTSAEMMDSPPTTHVHSSRSKISIFGKLTLPFISWGLFLVPAAKGVGQGREWTGQAGSSKDSAGMTWPRDSLLMVLWQAAPAQPGTDMPPAFRPLNLLMKGYFISPWHLDHRRKSNRKVKRKHKS